MSIKQNGGVFGRNPTFNDVTIEGQLTFDGDIDINSDLKIDGDLEVTGNSSLTGNVGVGVAASGIQLDVIDAGLSTQFRISNTASDATTKYGAVLGRHYTNAEENLTGMLLTSSSSVTGGTVSIGGGIGDANAANNIVFYTAPNNTTLTGSEAARFNTSGNLAFVSGKGIDFSATAGTGTSELLDDYEEGTWTPGISFGAGTTGIAYSVQVGKYTKVGDMVTASCSVTLSAKGSSTGVVKLTGLPFTASSDANSWTPVSLVLGVITFADFPQGYVRVSSTTVSINEITNAGGETTLTDGNFANNSTVRISATYRV